MEMASRYRSNGEVNMKKIQCFNCQKWGHYARDCWWKKVDDGWYPEYNPPPPPPALDVEANAEVTSAQGAEETVEIVNGDVLSSEHIKSESNEDQRQDREIVSNLDSEVDEEHPALVARGKQAIEQIREACMRSWTAAAVMSGFMGAQSVREDEDWQIVNITGTQSQMIMVCMIVITVLVMWISRRWTKTSQTPTIKNSNSRTGGPRGRALSAGYPLRERSVSSESSRSRSPDDTSIGLNPRTLGRRQGAQAHSQQAPSRERIVVHPVDPLVHRQRTTQEVAEPEPEIDSGRRDVCEERILENGESYTYVEFQQFFGEDAQRQWNQAPIRDFEAEESDVRVEAVVRNEASSSTARSSLSGGTTVEPHTVPEAVSYTHLTLPTKA